MGILRRYRFLIILCALTIPVAVYEVWQRHPSQPTDMTGASAVVPESGLPRDRKVFIEVYPNDPNSYYDRGLEFLNKRDFPKALEYFQKAVDTGVKSNEDLLWYYAFTLMHVSRDARTTDRAVLNWKRNFPHSTKYSTKYGTKYDNPYFQYAAELKQTNAPAAEVKAALRGWERTEHP